MKKYPNIIPHHCIPNETKSNIFHRIESDNNPPTFSKPQQLLAQKFDIGKKKFRKLHKERIIFPSKSEWSWTFHMVQKLDGTDRPVGDYR